MPIFFIIMGVGCIIGGIGLIKQGHLKNGNIIKSNLYTGIFCAILGLGMLIAGIIVFSQYGIDSSTDTDQPSQSYQEQKLEKDANESNYYKKDDGKWYYQGDGVNDTHKKVIIIEDD